MRTEIQAYLVKSMKMKENQAEKASKVSMEFPLKMLMECCRHQAKASMEGTDYEEIQKVPMSKEQIV